MLSLSIYIFYILWTNIIFKMICNLDNRTQVFQHFIDNFQELIICEMYCTGLWIYKMECNEQAFILDFRSWRFRDGWYIVPPTVGWILLLRTGVLSRRDKHTLLWRRTLMLVQSILKSIYTDWDTLKYMYYTHGILERHWRFVDMHIEGVLKRVSTLKVAPR